MMDFLEELAMGLATAAKKPNVFNYSPNSPTHMDFHKSDKVGRLLRGGNRSGKTVAGAVEGIMRSIGQHTWQSTHDVPTRGRIVTVDVDSGIKQIILPVLKQWIPPSQLVNGNWDDSWKLKDKVLTFRNGSTIEMKTHQQDIDSFAGVPLHWIWFDEECPKAIFDECRLRLIDYNGRWWMTMTPVEGQDWIFDRFIVAANKNVDMFEVSITDNPHLSKEALALLSEDLDDDEKKVREQGIFVPKGGLCLPEFNYSRHVMPTPNEIPKHWEIYVSIDHGYNNPTAILWHAVNPVAGDVVTFFEHYMRRWTIAKHADRIREVNKKFGIEPKLYVGDPSMSQRTAETGTSPKQLYQLHGIPVMMAKRDVSGRINKMNEYFQNDMWKITRDCPNTIKEIKGYSWKIYTSPKIADRNNVREEPNKKNDHAPDSAGYFFNMMPPVPEHRKKKRPAVSRTVTEPDKFPWEVDPILYGGGDDTAEPAFGEVY